MAKKQLLIAVLCASLAWAGLGLHVQAQDNETPPCGPTNSQPYSATLQLPGEQFDVYGRLGKPGQIENAQVFTQGEDGTCSETGSAQLEYGAWRRIGVVNGASSPYITFSLFSHALQGLPDANRPSLMLVSQANPPCQPTAECYVTVEGQTGYVRPTGTLLNEDSLHVVRVIDPAQDTIKTVEYYVGSKLAYTTPTLQPFDKRYLTDNDSNTSRVIIYTSGQKVVIPQTVETTYANSFERTLFKTAESNGLALVATVVLISSLVILRLGLAGARFLYAKRRWKQLHIANNTHSQPQEGAHEPIPTGMSEMHYTHEAPAWLRFVKYSLYALAAVVMTGYVVAMLGSYIIQPYEVDGVSMQSTLATGQQLLVNKTGKTWASLNSRQYLPKRGEIVVFQKAQRTDTETGLSDSPDKEYVVKRVVGLPGERVTVVNGQITIYTKDKPNGFDPDVGVPWTQSIHKSEGDNIDITLAEGQVFVVGDNRPESVDSRFNGPVDAKNIVGDVVFRLSPFTIL